MRFGVLGPVVVWNGDGRPVAVPGRKVRALLAALLLRHGQPGPADRLIDDLWPRGLPRDPTLALSSKVSQLRRVLDEAEPGARTLLVSEPAGYVLRIDPDRVDSERFESLLALARGTRDPAARTAVLTEALALWRGPALADLADEPFARPAIARLEELRLTAREDRAEVRLAIGEHDAVATELGELVAHNPFRERLRALHMRALYRAHRRGDALRSYEDLRAALANEVGVAPAPEVVAVRRAILRDDPALEEAVPAADARTGSSRTGLPVPCTTLIGRDSAVAELATRLRTDRLVTLSGPGGVGKTRLASEVAMRMTGTWSGGLWQVDLASVEPAGPDPAAAIVEAVMRVADVRDAPRRGSSGGALDRLITALGSRRLLLVLDGCEPMIEPIAELVASLLRAAPGLHVLATSREPLGLAAEVVWDVPPLDVPARDQVTPAALARSPAVRLFVDRAAAACRGFRLDAESAPAVAAICRRLDGIPLALELAASRVRALGTHGVAAGIDDRFRLLTSGHRDAPPRHRTLAATIGWSWDLLSPSEQVALRRLAVHVDGCSLEAAEAVCSGADLDAREVLALLARLVDRSMVVAGHGRDGPRYRLLESVAAYCVERLREAGELDRVRARHQRHYLDLAERAGPHLYGPEQMRWLRLLDVEEANLAAALEGAVSAGDAEPALRLAGALQWYWFLRGRLEHARRSLAAALSLGGGSALHRARATAWHAGMTMLLGDDVAWPAQRVAALLPFDDLDAPLDRARAEWFLAFASSEVDDPEVGRTLLDQADVGFRAAGDGWGQAATLLLRAKQAHVRGAPATLEREAERAERWFAKLGDRWGQMQASEWLGGLAELTGRYDRADRLHREGLGLARELGWWPDVAVRLAWLGWIAMSRRANSQARAYCEEGLRIATEHGHQIAAHFAQLGLAFAALRTGELDAAESRLRGMLRDLLPDADTNPPIYLSLIQIGLGLAAERREDPGLAVRWHREALATSLQVRSRRATAWSLEGMSGALSLTPHTVLAARLLGAAAAIRRSNGLGQGPAERDDVDRTTARIRASVPEDVLAAELRRGAALSPTACVSEVDAVAVRW